MKHWGKETGENNYRLRMWFQKLMSAKKGRTISNVLMKIF